MQPEIFISYAHLDNEKIEDEQTGWVSHFDQALTLELRARGLDVKVWKDNRDLDPDDFFDKEIIARVEGSKVLISVLSPRYVKQPYCLKELDTFVTTNDGAERVCKVLKRDLPTDEQPESVRGKTGFRFYFFNRETKEEIPLYDGYGAIIERDYWPTIRRVATSIQKRLATIPQIEDEIAKPAEPQASENGMTVFLAATSFDRKEDFAKVRDELEATGHKIVPDQELPHGAEAAQRAIVAALAQADISVHILGATGGFTPDGPGAIPITHLQLQKAAERVDGESRFRRLIWLPRNVQAEGESHSKVIDDLAKGATLLPSDEFVREPIENFKTILMDELTPEEASGKERFYLLCEPQDETKALDLRDALMDAGHAVELPAFDAGEDEKDAEHRRCLESCDRCIIVYGEASERWVKAGLDEIAARNSDAKGVHLVSTFVCLMQPASERKQRFRDPHIADERVVSALDGLGPDMVRRLTL